MSLARSASGPAGLSINTTAANSLTVPAAQPSGAGGLFGSGSTNATSATPAMATGGGLFGQTQQKPATGLFGQSLNTGTTATTGTTGGGLFGSTQPAQNQATTGTGGGLFGNAAANTAANTNTQQQPASTGGLFGSTLAQPTQQKTGTGLFGQSQSQGLFGQSTLQPAQTTPQQGGNLFQQAAAKTSAPASNSLFGQTTQQPVPAVQINWDSISPRTRFDDLAKPVQDEIALLDKGIQRVIKMKDEIGEFMPQHERDIEQLGRDVTFVESKFKTVQLALNNDIQTVKVLQDMTKKNIADAQLSFKATDNLKLPTHYHQTGLFASTPPAQDSGSAAADAAATHANAQDLITYFNRVCDDIERYKKRLDEYRSDIERDMPGVENGLYEQIRALRERGGGNAVVRDQLGEVLAALRDTGNAIVAQAGQIADTRERLSRLQAGILDGNVYSLGLAP